MSRIDLCGFINSNWFLFLYRLFLNLLFLFFFLFFFLCGCVRCGGIWESPFKALSAQPYRCSLCRTHRDSIRTGRSPSREYRHSAGRRKENKEIKYNSFKFISSISLHQHCWHVRQRMHHPNVRTAGWAHRANASRSSCWAQSIWPGSWPAGRTWIDDNDQDKSA